MKTSLTILIIILVVVVGGYIILKDSKPAEAPPSESEAIPAGASALETIIAPEKIITYTDNGYSQATLKIKAEETVVFKNESSKNMWPASAKHPTHEVYPTTGGCLGSTFDACKGVPPGESWSFKFDIKGDWKFHDHLTPEYFGSVMVE